MLDFKYEEGHCIVCQEDAVIKKGMKFHVCRQCFDGHKDRVVWVCLNCEEHYVVEKSVILENIMDEDFKRAFAESDRAMTVIVIGYCACCDPDGILKALKKKFCKYKSS